MDFSIKNKRLVRWLIAGLILKLILFSVYAYLFNLHWPEGNIIKGISLITADTQDYYQPIENLIDGKGYSLVVSSDTFPVETKVEPWAYRMPGLLPIYGPLYIFFGADWGKFLIILLQFICEIVSILLLAKTSLLFFKKSNPFYICLIIYVLNLFVSVYTLYATSEAFCISFFIFSFYFLFTYLIKFNRRDLFLCGFFLCWSIFFRSVIVFFLPIYVLIIIYTCYLNSKLMWKQLLIRLFYFLSVFLILDSIWVVRNYKAFHRFIPLHGSFDAIATKQELALYKLIITWGGDIQNWNPSEGRWFIRPSNSKTRVYDAEFQKTNPFPDFVFTSEYNLDSLIKLRSMYWKSFGDRVENDSALYYRELFISKTNSYILSFKESKPIQYYFLSKLKHAKTFILIQRPYGLPFVGSNLLEKVVRVVSVVYYYFILLFGFLGFFLSLKIVNNTPVKLFSIGVLVFIGMHSYFGYTEFRYLLPMYPIFTLFASYFLIVLLSKYRQKENQTSNLI